ncbi:MAG: hypothetical protein PHQ86_01295 [Dehalococcoidales bacterium]|nr:hypothetical protein [Dehalococcoidales bacterium]
MANISNLKEIEKKVFSSYFHDGMLDLYGGLMLLGFGLSILTNKIYLLIICITLAMVPLLIRKHIVLPRLGLVKFSAERQAKTKKSKLIALITGVFILFLVTFFMALFSVNILPAWVEALMNDYLLAFLGVMIASIVAIAAFIVKVRRFYIYAVVIFIVFCLASILSPLDMEGIIIVSAGGIILLSGTIIFIRFLHHNPLSREEIAKWQ